MDIKINKNELTLKFPFRMAITGTMGSGIVFTTYTFIPFCSF